MCSPHAVHAYTVMCGKNGDSVRVGKVLDVLVMIRTAPLPSAVV